MTALNTESKHTASRRTYVYVFLVLAAVTLVELLLSSPSVAIAGAVLDSLFLLLSLAKASLVAAFFMHLKYESRLYTYSFILPLILLIIFAYLASVS